MTVFLPDHNLELDCYFIGCASDMKSAYPIGLEKEATITFWHGNVQETDKREKTIKPSIVGIYSDMVKDDDGDIEYVIDSIITIHTDNELGSYNEPANIGSWVECSGQFVIEGP
ncbi:MAG: hypothetical protein ACRBBW_21230 [Cellvibrionaceae bacterium]